MSEKIKCYDELTKEEKEEIQKKTTEVDAKDISKDIDTQLHFFKRLPLPRREKVNVLKKLGYTY